MAKESGIEPAGGRKLHRSPNYPWLPLDEAVTRARVIYEKDRRTPTGQNVLLQHLGYSTKKSGTAGRVLSSLRQYGLLADDGGKSRVSDTAYRILALSEAHPDRLAAIREAALRPSMFRQVFDTYKGELPSDANLADHLITLGFNPDSTDDFIRSIKGTLEFAKLVTGTYNATERSGDEASGGDEMVPNEQDSDGGRDWPLLAPRAGTPPKKTMESEGGGVLSIRVPFGATGLSLRIEVQGDTLRREHLAKIRKYLELAEDDLPRSENADSTR